MTDRRLHVAQLAARPNWHDLPREEVIDPAREIVDPHHHLWDRPDARYLLEELEADCEAHDIVQTVFIECRAEWRKDGPEAFRPVGETEFVAREAARSDASPRRPVIAGIVAHADLRSPELDAVLDAHEAAGGGRFRGIRHSAASDPEPAALTIPGRSEPGLFLDPAFQRGLRRLGERGLTYDSWHYHHQMDEFIAACRAAPGTTIVMDHFGCPLGVGRFEGKRSEIFARWKDQVDELASLPNVHAKLGGLAMPDNGFGWHDRASPPSSEELADSQRAWHLHAIAAFGPERCMFESNFPVDRASVGPVALWNALKRIAADQPEAAKAQLFAGTARRVYKLPGA